MRAICGRVRTRTRGPARAKREALVCARRHGSRQADSPGGSGPQIARTSAQRASRRAKLRPRTYQCLRASAHIACSMQGPRMLVIAFMACPPEGAAARAARRSAGRRRARARADCGPARPCAAVESAAVDDSRDRCSTPADHHAHGANAARRSRPTPARHAYRWTSPSHHGAALQRRVRADVRLACVHAMAACASAPQVVARHRPDPADHRWRSHPPTAAADDRADRRAAHLRPREHALAKTGRAIVCADGPDPAGHARRNAAA